EQDESTVVGRVRARGIAVPEIGIGDQFFLARREAIMRRFATMNVTSQTPFGEIRKVLLPHTPEDVHPGVENVLKEEWEKYLRIREFEVRHSLPKPPGMQNSAREELAIPPLLQYSEAAAGGAFVDYTKFGSAVIRTLPLLLEENGRVYPQMG